MLSLLLRGQSIQSARTQTVLHLLIVEAGRFEKNAFLSVRAGTEYPADSSVRCLNFESGGNTVVEADLRSRPAMTRSGVTTETGFH